MVLGDAAAHAELPRGFLMLLILVAISVTFVAIVLLARLVSHRVLSKLFLGLEGAIARLLYRYLVLLLAALAYLFLLKADDLLGVLIQVCIHVLAPFEAVVWVWEELRLGLNLFDFVDELPEALARCRRVYGFGRYFDYTLQDVEPDDFPYVRAIVDLLKNLVL